MQVEKPKESLGEEIGKISHYYTKIGVAVVELTGELNSGDKIRIKGATTDIQQNVDSMQLDHEKVEKATSGQSIGLKVSEYCRPHDTVYKVE